MRRWIRMLVALMLAGLLAWLLSTRVGTGGGREAPRLDRGVAVEGNRSPIDPHGQVEVAPSSPLLIEARVEAQSAEEMRIEVEVGSGSPFDSVAVRAARFDAPGALEASWNEVVWTGKIEREATVHFEVRVPLGAAAPARVQLSAQAVEDNGARHTATAIVRPVEASP